MDDIEPPPPVTFLDGRPLEGKQHDAYVSLWKLMAKTQRTGKLQTEHPERHQHQSAAELLHKKESMQQWASTKCMRRYLVGQKFQPLKAYEAMMHTIYWREHHIPRYFAPSFYHDCLASRFMEWRGHDKLGHPLLLIKSVNADLSISREHRLSYMSIVLEKGVSYMQPQFSNRSAVEQWTMIVDETGKEYKHVDNKFIRQVSPIVLSHYVEHLHKCYIINPGVLTKVALGIIRLFLDPRTNEKIISCSGAFVDKKSPEKGMVVPQLLQDLGEECTPAEYGGQRPMPTIDEYIQHFNSIPPTS